MSFYHLPESSPDLSDRGFFVSLLTTGESDQTSDGGGEKTVDLKSSTKTNYSDYLAQVKNRIEKHWQTKSSVPNDLKEGTSVIRFTIAASGQLVACEILNSSGETALDEISMKVVRDASPFAPIPSAYNISRLHVIAHFHYTASP